MHSYCQLTCVLLWRVSASHCCYGGCVCVTYMTLLLWWVCVSQILTAWLCCYGEHVCVIDTDCMTPLLWWACLCHRYWLHDTVANAMVSMSVSLILTAWHCCYGECVCVTDTDCMTLLLWWVCLCHWYWLHDTVAMVSVSVSLILTAWHCCYGECVCVTDTDCMTLLLWWVCLCHRNTGKRSPSFRLWKKKSRCCSWRIAAYVKKCRTGNAHLGCLPLVNTYISLNDCENC